MRSMEFLEYQDSSVGKDAGMTDKDMVVLAAYYHTMKQQLEAEKWRKAIIKRQVLDRMVGR